MVSILAPPLSTGSVVYYRFEGFVSYFDIDEGAQGYAPWRMALRFWTGLMPLIPTVQLKCRRSRYDWWAWVDETTMYANPVGMPTHGCPLRMIHTMWRERLHRFTSNYRTVNRLVLYDNCPHTYSRSFRLAYEVPVPETEVVLVRIPTGL